MIFFLCNYHFGKKRLQFYFKIKKLQKKSSLCGILCGLIQNHIFYSSNREFLWHFVMNSNACDFILLFLSVYCDCQGAYIGVTGGNKRFFTVICSLINSERLTRKYIYIDNEGFQYLPQQYVFIDCIQMTSETDFSLISWFTLMACRVNF